MKGFLLGQTYLKLVMMGVLLSVAFHFMGGRANENEPRIQALKSDIAQATQKLKETKEKTEDKAKFQEEVERMSQTFRLALDYLPKELETQDLLKKIYSEARSAGVQLTHFKPKESISKDFYDELPMEIELKGNYPQLLLFLSYVSKIPRIINIKNVELGDPAYFDNVPTLKLKGLLVAYRYRDTK